MIGRLSPHLVTGSTRIAGAGVGGNAGGGAAGPISLPYLVDWDDGDISDISNVTYPVGGDTFRDVVSKTAFATGKPSYSKSVLVEMSTPENIGCCGEVDLGGPVDLTNGLKMACYFLPTSISASHYNVFPFFLHNGKTGAEANYVQLYFNYGQQAGNWVNFRCAVGGEFVAETHQADQYMSNGTRWMICQMAVSFSAGTFKMDSYFNTDFSSHVSAAQQSFTPFDPPTDLRYLLLPNSGSTSEWAPITYIENQEWINMWIGSGSDSFPPTDGSKWSL